MACPQKVMQRTTWHWTYIQDSSPTLRVLCTNTDTAQGCACGTKQQVVTAPARDCCPTNVFLVAAWHKALSTLQKLPPGLRELKDMSGAMLPLQLQYEMPRNPISYCVATQGSRPSAGKLKLL